MDAITPESCLVCRKHRGQVEVPGGPIFEDDLLYIAHGLLFGAETDHYLGHLFVETRRHVAELADLTEPEAQALGLYASRAARALMDTLGVVHVYSFVIGDGMPHVHVHLYGRYSGAPRPYWGPRVDEWPDAPRGANPDIADLNRRLRDYFASHWPDGTP